MTYVITISVDRKVSHVGAHFEELSGYVFDGCVLAEFHVNWFLKIKRSVIAISINIL